jgi:hypothetical protein
MAVMKLIVGAHGSNTLGLMLPFLSLLPEEMFTQNSPFEIAFDDADGPRGMVHSGFRDKSEALAKAGKGESDSCVSLAYVFDTQSGPRLL